MIISCESTVDEPYSRVSNRNIPVLFYSYTVDGKTYPDDMGRDPELLPQFYGFLDQGKIPSTSQINMAQYYDFLKELVEKDDVLHIAFGTGMTASVNNAFLAADQLREEYPNRKIIVIDSTCSSSGYGMLVDYAADMRDEGKSIEEIADWVEAHKKNIHHQFYSTDFKFYRKSGRMSGPVAMLGAVLNICPIMRLNDKGQIIAYDKVRGKKRAIARTVDQMKKHAMDGENYSGKCYICHSNCIDEANLLKASLKANFPNIRDVEIFDIGTIIASHCGPGTVAVFFLGDEREPYPVEK